MGKRGANLEGLRAEMFSDEAVLPAWLFVEGAAYKRGSGTWAPEKFDGDLRWAYADRLVYMTSWDNYFRLPYWPEGILRLGTASRTPLLNPVGDEQLCDRQSVYYYEAELLPFADPFLFLKPDPS